jgi:hypothetical protein
MAAKWYYIPTLDESALFICPCPKKSKKGLTKSGKPFSQRWFCIQVDYDGDFYCFSDLPASYMVEKYRRKPKKPDIYRTIIEYYTFDDEVDFSEYF